MAFFNWMKLYKQAKIQNEANSHKIRRRHQGNAWADGRALRRVVRWFWHDFLYSCMHQKHTQADFPRSLAWGVFQTRKSQCPMKTVISRAEAQSEETQIGHLLAHLECGFRLITEPQRALLIKLLREQKNKTDWYGYVRNNNAGNGSYPDWHNCRVRISIT